MHPLTSTLLAYWPAVAIIAVSAWVIRHYLLGYRENARWYTAAIISWPLICLILGLIAGTPIGGILLSSGVLIITVHLVNHLLKVIITIISRR